MRRRSTYAQFPETAAFLNMVVETPRGSALQTVRAQVESVHGVAFACARAGLPVRLGLHSGHKGGGWDPLDALAVHDSSTYPGVVLPCRVPSTSVRRAKRAGRRTTLEGHGAC